MRILKEFLHAHGCKSRAARQGTTEEKTAEERGSRRQVVWEWRVEARVCTNWQQLWGMRQELSLSGGELTPSLRLISSPCCSLARTCAQVSLLNEMPASRAPPHSTHGHPAAPQSAKGTVRTVGLTVAVAAVPAKSSHAAGVSGSSPEDISPESITLPASPIIIGANSTVGSKATSPQNATGGFLGSSSSMHVLHRAHTTIAPPSASRNASTPSLGPNGEVVILAVDQSDQFVQPAPHMPSGRGVAGLSTGRTKSIKDSSPKSPSDSIFASPTAVEFEDDQFSEEHIDFLTLRFREPPPLQAGPLTNVFAERMQLGGKGRVIHSLEDGFLASYFDRYRRKVQWAIFTATVIWALYVINDVQKNAEGKRQYFLATVLIRAFNCLTGLVLGLSLSTKYIQERKVLMPIVGVGLITFGVAQIIFGLWVSAAMRLKHKGEI
jgi:hypothetical protein